MKRHLLLAATVAATGCATAPVAGGVRSAGLRVEPTPPHVLAHHAASRGARRPHTPRRNVRPRTVTRGQILSVTAYCATGNPTASGVMPRAGMAAGNRWQFGTVLLVHGYGTVTVTDRIGYGSDLDLYFGAGADCERRALTFGRHALRVEVLDVD